MRAYNKLLIVAVLGCVATLIVAEIAFIDCGSDDIYIKHILVDNCQNAPCFLSRGVNYNVTVVPATLEGIDSVTLNVNARIRGANFRVAANFREPCGIPCPVTDAVPEPQIPIEFVLDTSLNPIGFSKLFLNATYWYGGVRRSQFCVELDIFILNS